MADPLLSQHGVAQDLHQSKKFASEIAHARKLENPVDQRSEVLTVLAKHRSTARHATSELVDELLRQDPDIVEKFEQLAFAKIDPTSPETVLADYNATRKKTVSPLYWEQLAARVRLQELIPRIQELESHNFFDDYFAKLRKEADTVDTEW